MKTQLLNPIRIFYLVSVFFFTNSLKAQYVTIPDNNFVTWLNANGYSSCLSGNQLDTTCNAIHNVHYLDCSNANISDITGIQYFSPLDTFKCIHNVLTSLPPLSNSMVVLLCDSNQLTSLPALPASLVWLFCTKNQLTSLPTLPDNLAWLNCGYNSITSLPALPAALSHLYCDYNQLDSIPTLPSVFWLLQAGHNHLKSLPDWPSSVYWVTVDNNELTSLPAMSSNMEIFICSNNQLTSIPALSSIQNNLTCDYNLLTSLPAIPAGMTTLSCSHNMLTTLPLMPSSMNQVNCANNLLTELPVLPDTMIYLTCDSNPSLQCFPKLPYMDQLLFRNTGIACVPNYPHIAYSSVPDISTLPLCSVSNPYGCAVYANMSGFIYTDDNSNCIYDGSETPLNYIPVQAWHNGVMVEQTSTGYEGLFSLNDTASGSYSVTIDTSGIPFYVTCPANGVDSVTITANDSSAYNLSFAMHCKPGFDVGAWSIVSVSPFRATENTLVNSSAGDVANFYGTQCSSGVSGSVQLIWTGPIHYEGPAPHAQTPTSVNGDTATWLVPDFSFTNFFTDYNIIVQADSNASAGDQVCFTLIANPITGDNNPLNNVLTYCSEVVSSHDPNEKEVSPGHVLNVDGDRKLIYTIHFQNTGNSYAKDVVVLDTLDANLDVNTFSLLAFSVRPSVKILPGNIIQFSFASIYLQDSLSDPQGSMGYVQFSIKAKAGLMPGVTIKNTAFIYFDLNPAVKTNTTNNLLGALTSVNTIANNNVSVTVFPNPAKDIVHFSIAGLNAKYDLELYDITGRLQGKIVSIQNDNFDLVRNGLAAGVYLYRITVQNKPVAYGKVVMQ